MSRAGLIALALVTMGCGAASAPLPNPEIATQYLYYKEGNKRADADQRPHGGVANLFVEVNQNPDGRAMVRFAEATSGGVGEAWRATVWMALLSAATALEVDPSSLRVTVEAQGNVDGPSAGALMAATIIAGARGDKALANVTMTGTVNADLTIGPVGGVPEKVLAAIAAGKKRIGVPVGQERALSQRSGKTVDLVALTRSRGVELVVLRDVTDAYALLTGHRLETEEPLPPEDMALPEWARQVFARHARETLTSTAAAQQEFDLLLVKLADADSDQAARAVRAHLLDAKQWLDDGHAVAALWASAQAHRHHHQLRSAVLTGLGAQVGEWPKLRELLLAMRASLTLALASNMPKQQRFAPWKPAEVPMLLDSFEPFIHTLRALAQGQGILGKNAPLNKLLGPKAWRPTTPAERQELAAGMSAFTALMISAQTRLILAQAYGDLGRAARDRSGARSATPIDEAVLLAVATQYERVADANLNYVDALLVRPLSEHLDKPIHTVRASLIEDSEDYRIAFMNRHLPGVLSAKILPDRDRAYANLTGSISSYFASAILISKRYSLGAVYGSNDAIVGVQQKEAFESMLTMADRQTRMVASRCIRDLGEIPLATRVDYQLARDLERAGRDRVARGIPGGFEMRVVALTHLWRAWTLGRVALTTHRYLLQTGSSAR